MMGSICIHRTNGIINIIDDIINSIDLIDLVKSGRFDINVNLERRINYEHKTIRIFSCLG
ncbi:hypothetical protein SAMN05216464_12723 [Mucilaginibacter pineti]|uniref:Uncharacterized protein n=1 Tax=Mucilaginibacter pineti TaxID=1391627 RepID=A0A1G7NHX4_9SPHI|nr:hypothetical protein SAMN05216464_12723 [Mucilaginibacter pineti]